MKDEKIIVYDTQEAATFKTGISGWVSSSGRFWGKDEHMARYDGCTHMKCECGNLMSRGWLKCESCRSKQSKENYLKLPYEEWDFKKPVVEWGGDEYFFDIDYLNDYMYDNEIEEIDLLICEPIGYRQIDGETVTGDAHEDWEPSKELEDKIKEFNDYLSTLPPHSWGHGKIRTSYKLNPIK